MTDKFEIIPCIPEGEYVAKLTNRRRGHFKFGRQDLELEFEITMDDFMTVHLKAYFRVEWDSETGFKAGQKSNFFRTYQRCCGEVQSTHFEISDLPLEDYRVEIESIKKDSQRNPLDPVNQYSVVRSIKGRVNNG